ncbi:MAG: hypothetical protein JWN57_1303 [Frankiales bacterium]|jgi:hypothetical protein|nr:hypothetical protein [Frankiales bacterium]
MTPLPARSNEQRLADAADSRDVEMWRAAQTVRGRVQDENGRQELLACLGLLDAARPAGH